MTPPASDYDRTHRRRRAKFDLLVRWGQIDCGYCGQRIRPGEKWHLGHSVDRTQVWPEHQACNCATSKRGLRHSRQW